MKCGNGPVMEELTLNIKHDPEGQKKRKGLLPSFTQQGVVEEWLKA